MSDDVARAKAILAGTALATCRKAGEFSKRANWCDFALITPEQFDAIRVGYRFWLRRLDTMYTLKVVATNESVVRATESTGELWILDKEQGLLRLWVEL